MTTAAVRRYSVSLWLQRARELRKVADDLEAGKRVAYGWPLMNAIGLCSSLFKDESILRAKLTRDELILTLRMCEAVIREECA